jgi:hypothetical protein
MIAGFFLGMWSLAIISKIVGFYSPGISNSIIAGLIGVLIVYTIFVS